MTARAQSQPTPSGVDGTARRPADALGADCPRAGRSSRTLGIRRAVPARSRSRPPGDRRPACSPSRPPWGRQSCAQSLWKGVGSASQHRLSRCLRITSVATSFARSFARSLLL
eukprot:3042792-Pyramimonas_sp.AAC.1